MKKHIITKINLHYTSEGASELEPIDAVELINLDETADAVKDGYLTIDDIIIDEYSIETHPDGSTARLSFSVYSTYEGAPEDFDKAMSDGWILWDCEVESAGEDSPPWLIESHNFINEIKDDGEKRFDLN